MEEIKNNETETAKNDAPKPGTKEALKAENDALKAELEALKAEKEARAIAKAEPDAPAAPEQKRVELFVPKGYANDEPNQQIIVNGVTYLLPKGKTSKVPAHVAAEFQRSQKAQEAMDKRVDAMLEASK